MVLFTLGAGYTPTARSLSTSIVDATYTGPTSDIARLYAVISVTEWIGSLIAALVMSYSLSIGIRWGQEWPGLPFGIAAVLFAITAVISFSITKRQVAGFGVNEET